MDPSARIFVAGHVDVWFRSHRPEYVCVAAGTVGGIHANAIRPAEFIDDNLMIHGTIGRSGAIDVSRLRTLGWRHRIALRDGIHSTYQWCLDPQHDGCMSAPGVAR